MKVIMTSDYVGQTVRNFQGTRLGTVVDLVIDQETAALSFAVISAAESEQSGERLIVVPSQALSPEKMGPGLRLGINEDRLKRAPALERYEFDTLGDKQVRLWVLSYFGLAPGRNAVPDDLVRAKTRRGQTEHDVPNGDDLARMLAAAKVQEEGDLPEEDIDEPGEEVDEKGWQEAA